MPNEVGVAQKSLFCVLQSLIHPRSGCSPSYNHMNEKKEKQNTEQKLPIEEQSLAMEKLRPFKGDT